MVKDLNKAEGALALPAEWEEQEAVWFCWPHSRDDWNYACPGQKGIKLGVIHAAYEKMISAVAKGQTARIIVRDQADQAVVRRKLARAGADPLRIETFIVPTDRSWVRDYLPAFVRDESDGSITAIRFEFTGWAKYHNYLKDSRVSQALGGMLGWRMESAAHREARVVLEGGAIDANGQGAILASEECLLDTREQCRNPGFSSKDYERVFKRWLGADQTIWLNRGIAGDDTHGHVDDFCRFVAPDTVLLAQEKNPDDENHRILEENRERLEGVVLSQGRLRILRLPMPGPRLHAGERLPASYANFLITNHAVLVPTFDDPNDQAALGIIGDCFPGRGIVGVDCANLILGLGAVHCLTHEQAAPKARTTRPKGAR